MNGLISLPYSRYTSCNAKLEANFQYFRFKCAFCFCFFLLLFHWLLTIFMSSVIGVAQAFYIKSRHKRQGFVAVELFSDISVLCYKRQNTQADFSQNYFAVVVTRFRILSFPSIEALRKKYILSVFVTNIYKTTTTNDTERKIVVKVFVHIRIVNRNWGMWNWNNTRLTNYFAVCDAFDIAKMIFDCLK